MRDFVAHPPKLSCTAFTYSYSISETRRMCPADVFGRPHSIPIRAKYTRLITVDADQFTLGKLAALFGTKSWYQAHLWEGKEM